MIQIDRNTKEHLVWTARNEVPIPEMCISHRIPRAWEQEESSKKSEVKEREHEKADFTYHHIPERKSV